MYQANDMNDTACIPLEFCATRFLEQWLTKESPIHAAMVDPQRQSEPGLIRGMLKKFSVQRNFPELGEGSTASEIAAMVSDVVSAGLGPVESVTRLAKKFENRFERNNVSAASKLLWMRCRYPVIIFDRQAVAALQFLSGRKDLSGDYARFFAVWCDEYGKRAEAVASASLGLAQIPRNYLASYAMDDVALAELIGQKWFQGRVFDLYLWEMGKS